MADEPTRWRAGDHERTRTLTALTRAQAAGRLTAAEASERAERVRAATFIDELDALVRDLPEGETSREFPLLADRVGGQSVVPSRPATPPLPLAPVPAPAWTLTVMSGRNVTLPPGTTTVQDLAWWGGNSYHLTDALGPGQTVVMSLSAVMAGHTIYVPDGVRVVDQTTPIMAGTDIKQSAQGDGSNGTLILRGLLFWAGIDVKLARDRRPGDSR